MKTIFKADDGTIFDQASTCLLYEKLLEASKQDYCLCYITPSNIAELANAFYKYLNEKDKQNEAIRTSKENISSKTEPQHTTVRPAENREDPIGGYSCEAL